MPLSLLGVAVFIAVICIFFLPADTDGKWGKLLYAIAVICFLLWLFLFFFSDGGFSYRSWHHV